MFKVIILTKTSELTMAEYKALLPMISLEKRKRIRDYRYKEDTYNSVLGEVLARVELSKITGIGNKSLKFSTNAHGKPSLANNTDIHFNIAYAGDCAVCAVSDEPVGIAIEQIKPIDFEIAQRFFTANETDYIKAGKQSAGFFEIWTKKEAYIKCLGKGLQKALSSFDVLKGNRKKLMYHKVLKNDDVICHVCSAKRETPQIEKISLHGLWDTAHDNIKTSKTRRKR